MTTKTVQHLRRLGYLGVNFNALLIPLLIYTLTHSALLAGVALLVEWAPKLGFYLVGGVLSARLSCRRAHLWLEWGRVGAFLAILGVVLGYLPWQVLMLAAALYQATNAISNIIFENLVTQWWSADQRAAGHSLLQRADLEAGILAMGLGILLNDPLTLVLCGLGLQLLTVGLVAKCRVALHAEDPSLPTESFVASLSRTLAQIPALDRKLLRLSVISMIVGLPAATLFSAMPFVLAHAFPAISVDARLLAMITLGRSIVTVAFVWFLAHLLSRNNGVAGRLAVTGAVLAVLGTGLSAWAQGPLSLVGLLLVGFAGYLYNPWSRTRRQEWLPADPAQRLSWTGVLISVEACSYLVGAGLIAIAGQQVHWLAVYMLVPFLLAATLAWPWCSSRPGDRAGG